MKYVVVGLKNENSKFHTLSVGTIFELLDGYVYYKGSRYGTFRTFCEDYETRVKD